LLAFLVTACLPSTDAYGWAVDLELLKTTVRGAQAHAARRPHRMLCVQIRGDPLPPAGDLLHECPSPPAQLPVERDSPDVFWEVQAESPLEIDCGNLQALPVDRRAEEFLECEHDEVAVRSHLQGHKFTSKHGAYLCQVRETAIDIAAHVDDEHASG